MKEYLKGLKFGLGIFSVLLVLGTVTFFVIKSRTATDPGLGDNGSSLYTSVNETLTAAKRNALVKSTKRVDVPTSDTALFDQNCDRRFQANCSDGSTAWFFPVTLNGVGTSIVASYTSTYRSVSHTTKGTISENSSNSWTMQKLQKKCQ